MPRKRKPKPGPARKESRSEYRERLLHSIAQAEQRHAEHPADCKGCDVCQVGAWGDRLHLAGLHVMLRIHDNYEAHLNQMAAEAQAAETEE